MENLNIISFFFYKGGNMQSLSVNNYLKKLHKLNKHFNYAEALDLNKDFDMVYVQVFFKSFYLLIPFGISITNKQFLLSTVFVLIVFVAFVIDFYNIFKFKNKLYNERYNMEKDLIIMEISKRLNKLLDIMYKINLDEERISYTKDKFFEKQKNAKHNEELERVLEEINHDINKYSKLLNGFTFRDKKSALNKEELLDSLLMVLELTEKTIDLNFINKKRKELLKKYHPDNSKDDKKAKEINEAYFELLEILK